ncbi:MAG TPA: hypothetical protein VG929_07175 [Actinomycetota bacterium]|nr:hypothetical protein [Actinomycetota bacterium]
MAMIAGLTLVPVAAHAAQQRAEPAVLTTGWWWEDAETQEADIQGNKVVVGTTSPFCPSAPGSLGAVPGACAEGRLPVEIIGGDYQSPNKLSALGFDLSYLTPGSTVHKFTVTLLEAEAGCTDANNDGAVTPGQNGDYCEETDPYGPVDDRQIQACLVPEIFGDAEAAPYKELPSYLCSSTDPVAERKEIKAVDKKEDADGVDHVWVFDLTLYAQKWAETFTAATNIMLVGNKPNNSGQQDSWRVVFAGPRVEKGIRTELVYEPGEIVLPAPPPGTGTTGGSTFVGGTTTTGIGGSDFGSGSTGFGTTGGTVGTTDVGTGTEPAPAGGDETFASDEIPGVPVQGMPGYVWLALLAGIVAFSMVRQVVIESASGVRPNGVLAKIHALNAERRGLDPAAASATGDGIGAKLSSLFDKLPFRRKG